MSFLKGCHTFLFFHSHWGFHCRKCNINFQCLYFLCHFCQNTLTLYLHSIMYGNCGTSFGLHNSRHLTQLPMQFQMIYLLQGCQKSGTCEVQIILEFKWLTQILWTLGALILTMSWNHQKIICVAFSILSFNCWSVFSLVTFHSPPEQSEISQRLLIILNVL